MTKRLLIIFFLLFFFVSHTSAASKVEIFHINKGKVIKEVPLSDGVQHNVETILEGITDIYREFEPIPKEGFMIKVPLDPAINVKNDWFHSLVSEVIVIFPEYENPHIMVFDDENNPFFFTFKASVDDMLHELEIKPTK